MTPIIVNSDPVNILYAIPLKTLVKPGELVNVLFHFKDYVDFYRQVVDFCDYCYVFDAPPAPDRQAVPDRLYTLIYRLAQRLKGILGPDAKQVDFQLLTRHTLYASVRHGVPCR